jgi:hypothetical protein
MDVESLVESAIQCHCAGIDRIESIFRHQELWLRAVHSPYLIKRLLDAGVPFWEPQGLPLAYRIIRALGHRQPHDPSWIESVQSKQDLIESFCLLVDKMDMKFISEYWGHHPTEEQHQLARNLVRHNPTLLTRILSSTALNHFPDVVEYALDYGFPLCRLSMHKVNSDFDDHWLFHAIGTPSFDVMIRNGVDPNLQCEISDRYVLSMIQTVEEGRLLLRYGADPSRLNANHSPLYRDDLRADLVRFYFEECQLHPIHATDSPRNHEYDLFHSITHSPLETQCHMYVSTTKDMSREQITRQLEVIRAWLEGCLSLHISVIQYMSHPFEIARKVQDDGALLGLLDEFVARAHAQLVQSVIRATDVSSIALPSELNDLVADFVTSDTSLDVDPHQCFVCFPLQYS